ncbi:hypothetical protein [Yoonia sp. BS5-3]|uniref:Uncharacterized protein n=1 Tax=Yoonia phaeophyticola TaxID=3137369 RepID=A0ABZ2UYP4_9RHOB
MSDVKKSKKDRKSVLSELNQSDRKPSKDPEEKSDKSVLSELNDSK